MLGGGLMSGCEASQGWWAQLSSGGSKGHRTGLSLCAFLLKWPGGGLFLAHLQNFWAPQILILFWRFWQ